MPFVQADIDALDAAYKSGARVVQTADGRRHELRTVAEYLTLRRLMEQEIAEVAGQTVNRLVRVSSTRGIT